MTFVGFDITWFHYKLFGSTFLACTYRSQRIIILLISIMSLETSLLVMKNPRMLGRISYLLHKVCGPIVGSSHSILV